MLNATDSPPSGPQTDLRVTSGAADLQRNWPLLIFVILSLLVQISVGQEENIEVNTLKYWLLIAPALIFPFFNIRSVINGLVTPRARLLLMFGVLAGIWQLLFSDVRAASQLVLFVWVAAWVAGSRTPLFVSDLVKLYIGLVLIGLFIHVYTDMNVWGMFPGATREAYGVWRVSFFPNIANTGMLSLFMLLLLTRNREALTAHPIVLVTCLYFLIFSFVRTAQIAAVLYLLMRLWFLLTNRRNIRKHFFWSAVVATIAVHALIAFSPLILDFAQHLPVISRLFLRGEEGLTTEEIFEQAYRPWLWWQHVSLFASSPGLMGLGTFEFAEVIDRGLSFEHIDTGSESLPTRFLATYGLPAILFIGFIIGNLARRASSADYWACACFPAIFLIMMSWGSVFHPTNAFFVLFFFILFHGNGGFSRKHPADSL